MKKLLLLALFMAWIQASVAQEAVQLTYVDKDNVSKTFEAVVTKPPGSDKKRAIVILHHK